MEKMKVLKGTYGDVRDGTELKKIVFNIAGVWIAVVRSRVVTLKLLMQKRMKILLKIN